MLPVAILAGGLATRLHPLTEKIPKSLIEVAGRPFIAWQLDYLRQQGVTHVVLCVGYLGYQIEEVIGDGTDYGLQVDYSFDGQTLLGTGGALRQALGQLGEFFFVFYGDSYLPICFKDVESEFYRQGKPALMTVLKNEGQWDTSNAHFHQGSLIEYNKHNPTAIMRYIDYGLGIVSSSIFLDCHHHDSFDIADRYHQLSLENNLAGVEVFHRFYEIGSHHGLLETNAFLEKGENNNAIYTAAFE